MTDQENKEWTIDGKIVEETEEYVIIEYEKDGVVLPQKITKQLAIQLFLEKEQFIYCAEKEYEQLLEDIKNFNPDTEIKERPADIPLDAYDKREAFKKRLQEKKLRMVEMVPNAREWIDVFKKQRDELKEFLSDSMPKWNEELDKALLEFKPAECR